MYEQGFAFTRDEWAHTQTRLAHDDDADAVADITAVNDGSVESRIAINTEIMRVSPIDRHLE